MDIISVKQKSISEGTYFENINENGALCWTYWDGVSKTEGHTKLYSIFCPICSENELIKDQHDKGVFKQKRYDFFKSVRCACRANKLQTVLHHIGIDGYIGLEKKTSKGNILKIKAVHSKSKSGVTNYIYECNDCSQDEEMYPYGSLFAPIGTFLKDNFNACACGGKSNLDLRQKHLKVERLCKADGNLIFHGFKQNSKNSVKGKMLFLKLECLRHFVCWNSTNYTNFCHRIISGKSGCPECKKAVSRELGRKINKGLYSGREDHTDHLYVMMLNIDGKDCIKVGRSFHPDRRLNEIRNDIERQGYSFKCKSLNYYIVEHKRCVYLENKLHQLLKNERLNLNIRFSGMCEIFSDTPETFKILSNVFDETPANKVQLETQP